MTSVAIAPLVLLAVVVVFALIRPNGWAEAVPGLAALAGAAALGLRSLAQHRSTPAGIARSVNLPFLVFVLGLGVVVQAVMLSGLDAAVLSNVVNNLPAVLVLLPLVADSGPAGVLAVLIGVNIGRNLT